MVKSPSHLLSVLTQDDMIGGNDEQITLELFQDLLLNAIVHVGGVIGVKFVDYDLSK